MSSGSALKESYRFSSTLLSLFFFVLPLDSSTVRSPLAQPVARFPPASWTPFKLENSNTSEFDWEDRNDTCLKGKEEAIISGMHCAGRNCAFKEWSSLLRG